MNDKSPTRRRVGRRPFLERQRGPEVTEEFLLHRSVLVREARRVEGYLEHELRQGVLLDEILRKLYHLEKKVTRWIQDATMGADKAWST